MKEDNLCSKNIKGDNSREIIIFAEPWVPFVLRPTVLVYQGETTRRQLQLYRDGQHDLHLYLDVNFSYFNYSLGTCLETLQPREILVEPYMSDLLVFHSQTDLHTHPLYTSGTLVLQDKVWFVDVTLNCNTKKLLSKQPIKIPLLISW